ncbi:CBS domain-containing protein [Acidisoma sp.]|uniref:CBS domain-containing protein n=1 Tax=Acidisoma sp. TaxID=1872115 RepID=UPI003AFF797A
MKVQDVMTTDVRTVGPDASIASVIAIMTERRVSGVPVVDEAGQLVGILTEGDLLRRAETGTGTPTRPFLLDLLAGPGREAVDYVRTHSRRVSDLMTAQVLTVTENDPLTDLVRLMERRRIRRVPVVREGRLVGIVSRFDLIAALGRALAASPAPAAGDAEIAAKVEREWRGKRWLGKSSIGIRVDDGVATLEGIIHDERMRDAIRVAAQNVPGVTAISDRIVYVEPFTGAIVPA